ncbi:phage integrase SAM-like domain-containing protein [Alistipes finegoldii]|uniref:Phage integrase SAM-like domain-containing protein n=1 Tax=Alistipes finegoldii TaxID=214856 RepID=A0AAE4LL64_9BACT|nr:phage integrase SAM-like domain-containing protein [Alistipes finegoldii]MDU0259557.1 phage integrase SAM-like domain-containing protein [Alistipes finegoldii]
MGNSQTYKQTQDMLRSYDRKLDQRLFSDIDLRYVRGFDMFLQKRGCCGNTRKFYFKALRAILNRANAEGVGSVATYPFGRGGFEVSKLEEATAKRYLPAARVIETQKQHGLQSAMRIRPQAVSILLLLLRHFVHRHGDAHGRPY